MSLATLRYQTNSIRDTGSALSIVEKIRFRRRPIRDSNAEFGGEDARSNHHKRRRPASRILAAIEITVSVPWKYSNYWPSPRFISITWTPSVRQYEPYWLSNNGSNFQNTVVHELYRRNRLGLDRAPVYIRSTKGMNMKSVFILSNGSVGEHAAVNRKVSVGLCIYAENTEDSGAFYFPNATEKRCAGRLQTVCLFRGHRSDHILDTST